MLVYPSAIDLSTAHLRHLACQLAVQVLAELAPTLDEAIATARKKAYLILDGTVLPIDRIAADRPYYSGKKKHHGMNVQVLTIPSAACCGPHPRSHGLTTYADKAYQGAGRPVRIPFRGRRLKRWQRRRAS